MKQLRVLVDGLNQSFHVAAAADLDLQRRIDCADQSGLIGQLTDGDDIKTKKPVQGEAKRCQKQNGDTEDVANIVLEDIQQEGLLVWLKILPEQRTQGGHHDEQAGDANSDKPQKSVSGHLSI